VLQVDCVEQRHDVAVDGVALNDAVRGLQGVQQARENEEIEFPEGLLFLDQVCAQASHHACDAAHVLLALEEPCEGKPLAASLGLEATCAHGAASVTAQHQ
jgi:hypothetical protein